MKFSHREADLLGRHEGVALLGRTDLLEVRSEGEGEGGGEGEGEGEGDG